MSAVNHVATSRPSIVENESFAALRARLGGENATGIQFTDLPKLAPESYAGVLALSAAVWLAGSPEHSPTNAIAWAPFSPQVLEDARSKGRPAVVDCWRLLSEETYGKEVDIVRLGRALGDSSPVLSAREEG